MALAAKGKLVVPLLLLLLLLSMVLISASTSTHCCPMLEPEKNALKTFYNSMLRDNKKIIWSDCDVSICCSWKGVTCDQHTKQVQYLQLPGVSFIGLIPNNSIGLLTGLRKLSLRNNGLIGEIPSDFSKLIYLRSINLGGNSFFGDFLSVIIQLTRLNIIDISGNNFHGDIPPDFSNLILLEKLNLRGNNLSGKFPSAITQLQKLNFLDISGNRFYGNIPCELQDLRLLKVLRLENNMFTGNLPGLHIGKSLNFSVANNSITGPVPTTLTRVGAEAFLGNPLLCGPRPFPPCNTTTTTTTTNQSSDLSLRSDVVCPSQPFIFPLATLAMSGGGALFLVLFIIILLFPVRRKQRPPSELRTNNVLNTQLSTMGMRSSNKQTSEMFIFPDNYNNNPRSTTTTTSGPIEIPSWAKGLDMTVLMSESIVMEPPLAKGNIGASYKVELALSDKVVVVKNLLDPKGVASDDRNFAKKMNFLGNMKSHHNVMPLRGYCIYKLEAYLLIYDFFPNGSLYHRLHEESTAVVLEWESRKRIALGVARGLNHLHTVVNLVHGNIKSSNILLRLQENTPFVDSSCVADFGLTATPPTSYYGPPETRRARSMSGDVYAFGVLLLELLTGKSPDVINLPEWVQLQLQAGRDENIMDSKMANTEKSEMVCLLQIAKQCTHEVAGERPTMEKVARMIENLNVNVNVNVKCRDHEIDELAAGPTDHEDPSHHEIYEESLAHPGTTPPPPPAYTPSP